MDKAKDCCIDDYELKAWIGTLGSMPVERVAHEDYSAAWEMDRAHVFRLENGQFALVTESGCSCYEPEGASIDLHPTLESAMKSFETWKKESYHHN